MDQEDNTGGTSSSITENRVWLLVAAIAITLAAFQLNNPGQMHPIWSYPYFSGAANYSSPEGWSYSLDHYSEIQEILKDPEFEKQLQGRRFKASESRSRYHLNDKGYVHIIVFAKTVFPFLSDMDAVELLQIIVHLLSCLFLLTVLGSRWQRLAFLVLYALNPIILSYVTFPFYYFWQALPAILLLPYLISKSFKYSWFVIATGFLLGLSFATRPTTLFISIFLFALAYRRENRAMLIASIFIMLLSSFGLRGSEILKSPWHTAYISIGAYQNPNDLIFLDKTAEDFYFEKTGERVNPDLPNGALLDRSKYENYSTVVKEGYLEYLKAHPFLLFRNGVLNTLQSFGLGYFEFKARWFSHISALLGLVFLAFLLWRKSWFFILAIFLATIGFAPYAPPVTRYFFGSFVLIIVAAIYEFGKMLNERRT